LPTAAGTKPALSDRPAARAAALVLVLLAAFLVARTCGSSRPNVTQEEAIAIAKEEVDFEPRQVQVRNVPRGLDGERSWAVSLYTGTLEEPGQCRVVEVDADDGAVKGTGSC
jgi:hypothetical protein